MTTLATEEDLDAALAELAEKAENEQKGRDLEIKRARVEYSSLGREGRDYAVVDTLEGVVVVQRVQAIVLKRWRESISGDKQPTVQKAFELVLPGIVSPEKETFKAWFKGTDSIALKVAMVLLQLHGDIEKEAKGKQ